MSAPERPRAPPSARATDWRAQDAALARRGSLLVRLDPEADWPAFAGAAVRACLDA